MQQGQAGDEFRTAIEVKGIEVTATLPLGDFRLSASYAFTDARVRATGLAAELDGKRPAQSPEHQGIATLAYFPVSGPQGSVSVRYAGAQFEDDLEARLLPRAITVDSVVSLPLFANVRFIARVENLFDEKIVSGISGSGIEDLGTPQTFWVGLRFSR